MSNESQSPDVGVPPWQVVEDAWRTRSRQLNLPAECEVHLIRVLHEMYEDQAWGGELPQQLLAHFYREFSAKLIERVMSLETELWTAGLRPDQQTAKISH